MRGASVASELRISFRPPLFKGHTLIRGKCHSARSDPLVCRPDPFDLLSQKFWHRQIPGSIFNP